jgi:2-phospho-L-lactate guanylyltransferase
LIFAVLPVKNPRDAKQRLSGVLAREEREALARAMYEHVIAALCAARGLDRIAVATSDDAIARDARRRGVLVFEEREQLGHSHSADAAARYAASLGATTVLLVPIDVPLVTPGDIEALAAAAPRRGLAIVPSSDGTGTNALVQTPPGVIACRFGPGSFQAHFEQARSRGIPVEVLRPPGLTFDLDTPEDAARLLALAPSSSLAPLLRHAARNYRSHQPA